MPLIHVEKSTHHHSEVPAPKTAGFKVRPHIAYLEFLKLEGLLDQAIQGELPPHVAKAAKLYVIGELREKFGKDAVPVTQSGDDLMVSVTEDEKNLQDEEVNDFLKTYNLTKAFEPFVFRTMPVEIKKGEKRPVKNGWFKGRLVLIKGLDRDHFGCRWDKNYGNPICEKYMFRIQQDDLPLDGMVYVARLLDEKRDILLHEREIGDLFQ